MATGLEIKYKHKFVSSHMLLAVVFVSLVGLTFYYGYRWYATGEEPPIPFPTVSADPSVSEADVTPEQMVAYKVPALYPRYLSIPELGIDRARVSQTGLTEAGDLGTPRNIHDVAWYTRSVTPGQGSGAVLIDGHSTGFSKEGIFSKLDTLPNGAHIVLERGDGKSFEYEVVENKNIPLEEVNKTGMKQMMFAAHADKEGLNIVSFSGRYIPKDKVFDHRIMLRAVRIE
ncbi:class F sortase [Candidatus Saccharibacteria bacterium]|nr:class F sortase [Candidatus Saccharibacteria bacterium]